MNTPRGKDLTKFVRYGSLNLIYQKGFDSEEFHSAPARKGFYAFPYVLQEHYLVGGLYRTQPDIFKKIKDGEYVDYDDYLKKLKTIRHVFTKKDGTIWHHLEGMAKQKEIIQRHKEWAKSSITDWIKIVSRTSINDRMPSGAGYTINSFSQSHGVCGHFSKDHYEVFFDEKI